MDETLLLPSPNWFLVSNLAVSTDGWIIYGGPSKSICVMEPLNHEGRVISGNQTYKAHVAPRSHYEKVLSVDVSAEFPVKRNFISGSADGTVKQWIMEKLNRTYRIKSTHTHEVHYNEKEEIIGVGYSTATVAITVGCFGNIVKWDLISNVCKTYNRFMGNFKPTCMACSPHVPMNVAIGTKQGVIFVMDLSGTGNTVYKVRGQDDEITNVSWCPQYEVLVNKTLKQSDQRASASSRMDAIKQEGEKIVELEQSGVIKNLPEDSFDETVVEEDDTFDIYKDHEADEFGHKKYEPEDILVKVKDDKPAELDYLAECLKLKDEILKRKNQDESSIASLVDAMDKTHVDKSSADSEQPGGSTSRPKLKASRESKHVEASMHVQKHLLATIGKFGGVRVWSKTGKLVASCLVHGINRQAKNQKLMSWATLLWYKPDSLLIADGKSQLVGCNPLKIDCKNKLEYSVLHALHKRGLYAIVSDAPRVQKPCDSPESQHWTVYTASQDRNIIRYCMKTKRKLAIHSTCGGYVYNIQSCPYDAGKIAIGVGDGAVRVWQSTTLADDDTKLYMGRVQPYWQNVQGKVLTVAWHPTKENCLAYGTGESRVGLLDTSGRGERPARALAPALSGAVYSLCWGPRLELWAAAGARLQRYCAARPHADPESIEVVVEGEKWQVVAASWSQRGILCGSSSGCIAVLDPETHQPLAVSFLFNKMIHSLEWHPIQTSYSSEESAYKNLFAATSMDRHNHVAVIEYTDKEGGGKALVTYKMLSGHKSTVFQVSWSPHREEHLLSTSHDSTVRIWDITSGVCISIFGGHMVSALSATWLAMPQFETKVLSGGGDACLRLWDMNDHKPEHYEEVKHETMHKQKKAENIDTREEKKRKPKEEPGLELNKEVVENVAANVAVSSQNHTDIARKSQKKFIMPLTHKQMNPCPLKAVKRAIDMYVKNTDNHAKREESSEDHDLRFLKLFGSINDVNEVLDNEMENLQEECKEGWMALAMFRGQIDSMIQFASQNDMLYPFLISMAPCVSFKYWKETMQLYIAQIDRLVAKGKEEKVTDQKFFVGPVYRKAMALLSIHDVKGAVVVLNEAKLFKEAYVLCRLRYMDSIAEETLQLWAKESLFSGNSRVSAICNIALGNIAEAATILAKFKDQESLSYAADLAKLAGRTTFADHVEKKAQLQGNVDVEHTEELLEELPSRIQLLLVENAQNDNLSAHDDIRGEE
ncbi:gem nuclear organelle associated protein rigor mortis [Anticarsia gemmatalis]|uniref:gem nuclear organelle associated protein rigor mortis n=1 Tax=Anticarsia gemmatalis TaxID=129554 RepID=UPI003F75E15E